MNECGLELDCLLVFWFDGHLGLSRKKGEDTWQKRNKERVEMTNNDVVRP